MDKICDDCGTKFEDGYCPKCQAKCDVCQDIDLAENVTKTKDGNNLCMACQAKSFDCRYMMDSIKLDTHTVSDFDMAQAAFDSWIATRHWYSDNRMTDLPDFILGNDFELRWKNNLKELLRSDKYHCKLYEEIRCPKCGDYGIEVIEGEGGSISVNCTHCDYKVAEGLLAYPWTMIEEFLNE